MIATPFATREAWLSPPTMSAGALTQKAERARAEFISSTEPECAAERAYAAEDAHDLAALATSLRSFLTGAKVKLSRLNYGKASCADLELMGEIIAEQIGEVLTPEAARYFDAELANGEA